MKTRRQIKISTIYSIAVLIFAMGWIQQNAMAESESQAEPAENAQLTKEQAMAKDLVLRMAKYLATTKKFSVNLESSFEVLQESGQVIEFGENRKIIVSRPYGLHVEVKRGNGDKHIVRYDGNKITIFNPLLNVYAQAPKTGGIDEAVKYFLRDLGMRLPLAVLLISTAAEEIDRRTLEFNYIGNIFINGAPVHHIAGRTETVDYQVWIPEGAKPLPLRVVLTYKNEEGQPTHRAQFSDWNITPEIKGSLFAFIPPRESKKIAFLAQLPKAPLDRLIKPEQTGESK